MTQRVFCVIGLLGGGLEGDRGLQLARFEVEHLGGGRGLLALLQVMGF